MRKEEDSNKFKEEKEEEEEIDKTFIQLTNDGKEKNKVKQKEKIEKEKKEAEDKKEREAKESEKINKESDYEDSHEKKMMEGKFELNGKNIIKIQISPNLKCNMQNSTEPYLELCSLLLLFGFLC